MYYIMVYWDLSSIYDKSLQMKEHSWYKGGFYLHLLVFPFVYQFNSRLGRSSSLFIICKWLVQKDFNNISASFQNLFVVYSYLFCCTEMRWLFISSTAIWVTDSDTSSVASRARTKLTSSKFDWTRIWTI
jgi:hypothetical protein